MKLAYLDCSAGIAGDMCLGALIDCGVPIDYLTQQLRGLGLAGEFQLTVSDVHRCGQPAKHVFVDVMSEHAHAQGSHHDHPHARHWPEIRQMIESATLPPQAKLRSQEVFYKLAQAEAKVHQQPITKVHFHEVGAVDAIVDIVGTCLGLDWLKVEKLICSPHPIGGGWVQVAHGQLAVPVPAVIQLWEDARVPVYSNGIEAELVTPTGAALAVTLASDFGPCPALRVEKVGRGAGTKEFAIPNILRLWLGESSGLDLTETVTLLETQIDDLNPQIIGYVFDQLFQAGALDVFTQAITMKQSRSATLLSVIVPPDRASLCEQIIFRETTTLGIRRCQQQRTLLAREIVKVSTRYGEVGMKVARQYGQIVNGQPEFRDCAKLAGQAKVPVQTVWLAAQWAWQQTETP
ncbi:MAG: nickel pincer cofactor biosynthesis protein LarC [Cyanobacteriota bacterium]|nr:nickel pincer cofactor biosynthesis protein LarC [Cyanobacteriota bacterium]